MVENDLLDDYTGITLKQCPQFTSIQKDKGGNAFLGGSNHEACTIRRLNECMDQTGSTHNDKPEYCMGGADYICPNGFKLTSAAKTYTFNDCVPCT